MNIVKGYKIVLAAWSSIILFSCGNHPRRPMAEADVQTWEVNFKNRSFGENLPLRLSDILDTVYQIPLEEKDCQIGIVKDIKHFRGQFYILHDNVLSVFDRNGHYLRDIGQRGRAANEYYLISFFDVHPVNGQISLYDATARKIRRYSENGIWQTNVDVKDVIRDMAVLDNGDYVFYTPDYMKGNRRGLWQTDSMGVFKRQCISIDEDFLYGGIYPRYFCRIDSLTLGLMGGEDRNEIYHITTDTVRAIWRVSVDIKIPTSLKSRPILNFNNYPGKVYTKNNYLETKDIVYLVVSDMRHPRLVIYHKTDGVLRVLEDDKDVIADMPVAVLGFSCEDALIGMMETGAESYTIVVMKTK